LSQTATIKDLLPKEWFNSAGEADVLVSVYHCLTNILTLTKQEVLTGTIFNSFFLITNKEIAYDKAELIFKGILNNEPVLDFSQKNMRTIGSPIIFFFLKYSTESEPKHKQDLRSVRGLLSSIEGKNSNFDHLYDEIMHFPNGKPTIWTNSFKSFDPIPAFHKGISVGIISQMISNFDADQQNRIKLALRWIDGAEHETQPLDEFLKLWFAIETLAMPDTTTIKPLVKRLSSIYEVTYEQAQENFKIGLIFSLRSNIVHNGLDPAIHSQLNKYLRGIFNDVLLNICGLPSKKLAIEVLNDSIFSQDIWLPKKDLLKKND